MMMSIQRRPATELTDASEGMSRLHTLHCLDLPRPSATHMVQDRGAGINLVGATMNLPAETHGTAALRVLRSDGQLRVDLNLDMQLRRLRTRCSGGASVGTTNIHFYLSNLHRYRRL